MGDAGSRGERTSGGGSRREAAPWTLSDHDREPEQAGERNGLGWPEHGGKWLAGRRFPHAGMQPPTLCAARLALPFSRAALLSRCPDPLSALIVSSQAFKAQSITVCQCRGCAAPTSGAGGPRGPRPCLPSSSCSASCSACWSSSSACCSSSVGGQGDQSSGIGTQSAGDAGRSVGAAARGCTGRLSHAHHMAGTHQRWRAAGPPAAPSWPPARAPAAAPAPRPPAAAGLRFRPADCRAWHTVGSRGQGATSEGHTHARAAAGEQQAGSSGSIRLSLSLQARLACSLSSLASSGACPPNFSACSRGVGATRGEGASRMT